MDRPKKNESAPIRTLAQKKQYVMGDASLFFERSGEFFHGKVLAITKKSMSVILPVDKAKALGQDDQVKDIRFHSSELKLDIAIEAMQIKRFSVKGSDGAHILLQAANEASSNLLWWLADRLEHPVEVDSEAVQLPDEKDLKIPGRGHYTETARLERVNFIREHTGQTLARLNNFNLRAERLTSNVENLLGSVEIPVGVAGPLFFRGQKARGVFFVPLATTEGALVASMTRGATAISRSGGIFTRVLRQQMIRVPFFRFSHMASALHFTRWLEDHFHEIKAETQKVSRNACLVAIEPMVSGRAVNVRFIYETGDAAGQNMTTTCTWQACLWVLKQIKSLPDLTVENFLIEGNLSGDKKVNYLSFVSGRGIKVVAETFIKREHLEHIMKVTPEALVKGFTQMAFNSSTSGQVGININIANTIAAIFTATGQDIACVHESSLGVLYLEAHLDGIYLSLVLPALVIGTVGGGTGLPDQNQFLDMMGCAGTGQVMKFAELIAGFCLALDLSTMCAIVSGQFATAHEKLGRNRPINWFTESEFVPAFFTDVLQSKPHPHPLVVDAVEKGQMPDGGSSIITELTAHRVQKALGHFRFQLRCKNTETSKRENIDLVAKIKPMDSEVLLMILNLASLCDPRLAQNVRRHSQRLGFKDCHLRELAVYSMQDPRLTQHMPHCYGVAMAPEREMYIILMESLADLKLFNVPDQPKLWQKPELEAVVKGLGSVHSAFWKQEETLKQQPWIGTPPDLSLMTDLRELWELLGVHAAQEFPEWFTTDDLHRHTILVEQCAGWWSELEKHPRTLVHNDCNPRNAGLRETAQGLKLCLYDWELATIHLPQHDLAEFLLFTGIDHENENALLPWIEMHRIELSRATGDTIDPLVWRQGFALSVLDLAISRVPMYIMAHTARHYPFMEHVFRAMRKMLSVTQDWLE